MARRGPGLNAHFGRLDGVRVHWGDTLCPYPWSPDKPLRRLVRYGILPRHLQAVRTMVVHPRSHRVRLAVVAAACVMAPALRAQQPAAPPAQVAPDTGAMAPDFTVPGATRDGVMNKP